MIFSIEIILDPSTIHFLSLTESWQTEKNELKLLETSAQRRDICPDFLLGISVSLKWATCTTKFTYSSFQKSKIHLE